MNAGQAKTLILRYGFDDSDPIFDWLNMAQSEFYDSFKWPWFRTGVSNSLAVGSGILPLNITPDLIPEQLVVTINNTEVPVEHRGFSQVVSESMSSTDRGAPVFWTQTLNGVEVRPLPDAIYPYTLYYSKGITLVDDAADGFIDWPSRYHYIIVRGATAFALEADNQEERAATHYQKFLDAIDRAITNYRPNQTVRLDRVRNAMDY